MQFAPQSTKGKVGGFGSVSNISRKTIQPIFVNEDLQEQLYEFKKNCNKYKQANVELNTQNKTLKKEIMANEKVI